MKNGTILKSLLMVAFTSVALGTAGADDAKPKYGGTLTISPYQASLRALSWDPADWNWKVNIDAGPYLEQLIVGDVYKGVRTGGTERFVSEAWLKPSLQTGELAESWELQTEPLAAVFHLRKNVMWQDCPGVMTSRPFNAEDVVYAYNRLIESPKLNKGYIDFVDRAEATDEHTVTFYFNSFNAEWDLRLGYGFYSAILPREVAEKGAQDWRNACGTGPFKLADYEDGIRGVYKRNPDYWGKVEIGGESYQLPFVDELIIQTVKDPQTRMAAFNTGKIDVMVNATFHDFEALGPLVDKVHHDERPPFGAKYIGLRMDEKPFDDIRVRRAMNLAIDKKAILEGFYGGHAEMLSLPLSSSWSDYFIPLEKMPPEVQELFTYDPEKAKALIAEAGYPDGFTFKMQISTSVPDDLEVAQIVAAYLSQIGVTVEIETLEYGALLSSITSGKFGPAIWNQAGLTTPTAALDKHFTCGSFWNTSRFCNEDFTKGFGAAMTEQDVGKRITMIQDLTKQALSQAPYIFMPMPSSFTFWWPWVKNYAGEQAVGAQRNAPLWAHAWIDADLKKQMGF